MKNDTPSEHELKAEITAAQKVWSQRIDETDRARRAERVARGDLVRAVGHYVRRFTKRI